MSPCSLAAILWCAAILQAHPALGQSGDDQPTARSDVHTTLLSDGSCLSMFARVFYLNQSNQSPVVVSLRDKSNTTVWRTEFPSLDYVPGRTCYYGLAKITEDRLFLFFTWNARHCTLDTKTGRILDHGEGDDALKHYDSLIPLQVRLVVGPSTGRDASTGR